jgi:hypothetical protein
LPCYGCHKTGNFGGLSPNCYSCHAAEMRAANQPAFHLPGLTACGNCHNPNSWVPGGAIGQGFLRESVCR